MKGGGVDAPLHRLERERERESGVWLRIAPLTGTSYCRSKEDMRRRVGGGQVHLLREHDHSDAEMREKLALVSRG